MYRGDTDPYWKKEEKICRDFRFRSDLNTYIERIYLRERYRRERKKFIGFILIVSKKFWNEGEMNIEGL